MSNIMKLQIPLFLPGYDKNRKYGYTGKKGENLLDLLYQTSKGYCMYCYSKIEVDSKRFGHLEHAIEKSHCEQILKDCVPNIGLACPKCNQSFKTKGDDKVTFSKDQIDELRSCNCRKEKCQKECKVYKELKYAYIKQRSIILQPMGVNSGAKEYRIQYNLYSLKFEPSSLVQYSHEEFKFIEEHIKQFKLNDSKYRTKELFRFCEDILNGDKSLRIGKYNNMIVDLLIDHIKGMAFRDIEQLCEMIHTIGKMKKVI